MSIESLIAWTYLVGLLAAWPIATRRMFDYFKRTDGDATGDTYVGAAFSGAVLAVIWPLMLVALFVRHPLRIYLFGRTR